MMLLAVGADPANLEDFGRDPIWLTILKVLAVFVFLVLTTLLMIWAERRVVGRMQQRPGPNRVGPFGLLQSLADGLKLAFKEDIIPTLADKWIYLLAPALSAIPAILAFAVIPFGGNVSIFGTRTNLQITDLPVGVLFVLAASSLGVYGIVLAGWASGSTYPLLGSLRSAAQMISYEIGLGLSFAAVFLYAGTMTTSGIVDAQEDGLWYAILLFPSFAVYCISAVAETNRAPFDLPEAESELVGGFHTEYSSLKFAMFFLAEYINMVTQSAIIVTLFLGGFHAPWPLNDTFVDEGWFGPFWFILKLGLLLFVYIWLRGTLPRLRYDQLMALGWKVTIPVSLLWILVVATVRTLDREVEDAQTRLYLLGGAALVALLAVLFWPDSKSRRGEEEDERPDPIGHASIPIPTIEAVAADRPPSPVLATTAARPVAGSGSDEVSGV